MTHSSEVLWHLERIQDVVSRLATNCFAIKTWSVTLVSATIALAAAGSDRRLALVAYVPAMVLWLADAYYLSLERRYRELYDVVRVQPDTDLSLHVERVQARDVALTATSVSVLPIHLTLLIAISIAGFAGA